MDDSMPEDSMEPLMVEETADPSMPEETTEPMDEFLSFDSSSCIWTQGDSNNVVISTAGSASNDWRAEGDGIVYKPWNFNPGHIDPEGSSPITFRFNLTQPGEYYITAKSIAQDHTEFNDFWLRFSEGMRMTRLDGTNELNTTGWRKAYQNDFVSESTIYTVDHDPHQFQTLKSLEANKTYEIEIAGRSTRFYLEKLLLVKCHESCLKWEPVMEKFIAENALSQCL
eukprot:Plantae.Rhodophyta-Palmaria_palmata.ctg9275.p1 GENE.Plantae.Rhodophyta-Palmaria_palmata.ctg9275~~Plantae.Rhodophyta-Palmaria_palmata.ctg9275.p1  ORF type:complete len:234 (+),score=26.70 Plantae.Rhodophyta-Palmaria_palmata.ctg9275:27-704(+)